jgi:hypothetical protein
MGQIRAIALDLEGTLISNAVSQFPRPGLWSFLEFCRERFEEVFLFTAVREDRCREIAGLLADEGSAPAWFRGVPCVEWDRVRKDLSRVPGIPVGGCLLLDDNPSYVRPDQKRLWIRIAAFDAPYPATDSGLATARRAIRRRLAGQD